MQSCARIRLPFSLCALCAFSGFHREGKPQRTQRNTKRQTEMQHTRGCTSVNQIPSLLCVLWSFVRFVATLNSAESNPQRTQRNTKKRIEKRHINRRECHRSCARLTTAGVTRWRARRLHQLHDVCTIANTCLRSCCPSIRHAAHPPRHSRVSDSEE
jgi:hypothetical protein